MLISHINPDGDAIGSQLALYHFLKAQGRNVGMMTPNYLQEFLKWMTGAELIDIFIKSNQRKIRLLFFDVVLACTDIRKPLGTLTFYCKEVD